MKYRMVLRLLLLSFLLSFSVSWSVAAELATATDLAKKLESLMERNVSLTQAEDIEGVMATVHTKSPIYAIQMNALQQLNLAYDLEYEVLSFSYVGQDENFAYARFKLKTSKLAGPAFRNNEINALVAFRQEDGDWKLWNQVNLEVTFEEPSQTQ